MEEGTLINYRLRLRGIPIRWTTRINVWKPPHLFVDEQIRGPYRKWIHEHVFEPKDGGTVVFDKVHYAVALDLIVNRWLARPDIERIFRFRAEALKQRFGSKT